MAADVSPHRTVTPTAAPVAPAPLPSEPPLSPAAASWTSTLLSAAISTDPAATMLPPVMLIFGSLLTTDTATAASDVEAPPSLGAVVATILMSDDAVALKEPV